MSKNTNRKGLALGAIFSLVVSLFAAAPAQASTTALTITPASGTSYTTFIDEDFTLVVTRNLAGGVTSGDFTSRLRYELTPSTTWSIEVAADAVSNSLPVEVSSSADANYAGQEIYYNGLRHATDVTVTFSAAITQSLVVKPQSVLDTETNKLSLVLGQQGDRILSSSPQATVTVKAFLDTNNNNIFNDGVDTVVSTQVVTFAPYSALTRAVTIRTVAVGETTATVDATVSGVNLQQLSGTWALRLNQWGGAGQISATSFSQYIEDAFTFSAPATFTKTFSMVAASASNSVSADLYYVKKDQKIFIGADSSENSNLGQVIRWANAGTFTPAAQGVSAYSTYAVEGDNVLPTAAFPSAKYDVRRDSTYTIQVSASGVLSASAVTATFTFSNPALSSTKFYSVNGGTAVTTGTHSAVTATVNSLTGMASITVRTTGFATGDALSISATVTGRTGAQEISLYAVALTYTLTRDASDLATTPGGTVGVGVTVKDQFGVNSSALNQRVKFSWRTGYSGTATESDVVLSAGRATANMVHSPATSTVAATVRAQLQEQTAGVWADSGTHVTINVTPTNAANGFRTGLALSYSATISYGAVFSWSPVINDAYVVITGSSVVVSGTGLIFKDDVLGLTASDRITLPGDSNARVKFYVTARKAGTYTLTLTAGTATTTSLIVVSNAQDNAGSAMAFDISSMESGRAAIVTGTLTDINGNAVDTSLGNASIALSVTGTGATYVGSLNTETNADGKFQVALLSGTNQTGTITITAVYSPTSGASATAKVTKVHTVSVVAPTAPEVNAVIGSFNGRWAVRVENARGSVVSVKAGNRWVRFSALNNNYLFSRKSVVGRTIAVSVWVDGELQNSQTITIK
jgi:hypothetical protein